MERQIAKTFNEMVEAFIEADDERESLYLALATYQRRSHDLAVLALDLREIINCPGRMVLYNEIRPLIPPKHQMDYDQLIPRRGNNDLRTVRLKRRHNEGLGFAVRGGLEHGIGLFVSHVVPDSPAYKQNIKVGDEIVRVNGFTINQAIHQEALHLIKSRRDLVLRMRSVGLIPVKDKPGDKLSWSYVNKLETEKVLQKVIDAHSTKDDHNSGAVVKLYVDVALGSGLGCSITSGPSHHPGIFIQSVRSNSLAQQAGLRVGDQILEVNGYSFHNISHSEAVEVLKGSRHLDLKLKRGAGLPLFQAIKQVETPEEERGRKMREDAAASEAVMEQVLQMGGNKGREVTIHIEDKTDEMTLEKLQEELRGSSSGFGEGMSQPSTLSSSASSTNCLSNIGHSYGQNQEQRPASGQMLENALFPRLHRKEDDPSLQEKHELERLKRDYLAGKEIHHDLQTPVTEPIAVVTDQSAHHPMLPITNPVFMQQKRAFRFQKPVLLSPVKSEDPPESSSNSSPTPMIPLEITEDNFNPTHLFTNEQIAGRQVELVSLRKNRHQELGLELALGSGATHRRAVVSQIRDGSIAQRQGGLHIGDELLVVDGIKVYGVSVNDLREIITESFSSVKPKMQVVVAKAPPQRREEEIQHVE